MKTFRLITIDPLAFYSKSLGGLPNTLTTNSPPPTPDGYAYVEDLAFPEMEPSEGFRWTRELTTTQYGWTQTVEPPAPNPVWYSQPAWRVRAVVEVTPFGDGTLMDAVSTVIDTLSGLEKSVARQVFYHGNTLERDSTLLTNMAAVLGVTDETLDLVFQTADAIEV